MNARGRPVLYTSWLSGVLVSATTRLLHAAAPGQWLNRTQGAGGGNLICF